MLHILCDLHHVRCAPNDRNAADGLQDLLEAAHTGHQLAHHADL